MRPDIDPADHQESGFAPVPDATAAFEAAVRMHYVRLSRFAFRMVKSWDVAEDAVQEAFFKSNAWLDQRCSTAKSIGQTPCVDFLTRMP